MICRPATAVDAAAIGSIWNPMIRDTAVTFNRVEKSVDDIAALIAERQAAGKVFLVAEAAGGIAGFASYQPFRSGSGYARTMEHTLIVAPGAQGRGVGRALIAAIEAHAGDAGVHSMFAGVSGENPAAIAFHLALGYRKVAVLAAVGYKFGRWMDLHLLQKHL